MISQYPRDILVLTEIDHLPDTIASLQGLGRLLVYPEARLQWLAPKMDSISAVFTNPNSARFHLGKEFFGLTPNLKVICTASTGTNHIDLEEANRRGIAVLSLREEINTLEKISSTAELALALTLSTLRRIVPANHSVAQGNWDYRPFIGRQASELRVGVVGMGRLGRMYARMAEGIFGKVSYFDPFVDKYRDKLSHDSLESLFRESHVVSLHVHPDAENIGMINSEILRCARNDLTLVNTSRGEIVNERDVVQFLRENPDARVASDVLSNEIRGRSDSPLLAYSRESNQVLLTPHIGGMTIEGQSIAYLRAAEKLRSFFLSGS